MRKYEDNQLQGLDKLNIRNYINHHFNEYLSIAFVLAVVFSFVIRWKIQNTEGITLEEGYRNIASFLGIWNGIGLPAAFVMFIFARKWLHESFDIIPPPKHLYKQMTYPIHVSLQLIGIVVFLTMLYFLTSLIATHTLIFGGLFVFFSMAMYIYIIDFFMYSVQTAIYLKDTFRD